MAPKISLLNVSPDACLLKHELAAQKFIVAANAVFLKAQGLATLVPLHKTAFGLLEGLLDDWHQLNLTTIKWLRKAEVCQACINIWSLNKQAPWAAEFGKMVVLWEHAISTIEQIKLMHFEKMAIELELSMPMVAPQPILLSELSLQEQEESAPQNKGKAKAKATEDDDNDKETAQKLRKELEEFVAPTTCDHCIANNMADHCWYPTGEHPCWRCYRKSKGCLWNGVSVRTQKKHPPLAALVVAKHVKLVQAVKAFLEWQGKPSQFFVLEGYKGKGKAKALVEDSEPMGTKRSFKLRELVDSNSDEKEEEAGSFPVIYPH
ncbi:hypothetical protein C0995_009292 [Termitomyces sp. Mi166|nr:hypothetical protein C0995_009292 [Termitomyces sp. Mi166\